MLHRSSWFLSMAPVGASLPAKSFIAVRVAHCFFYVLLLVACEEGGDMASPQDIPHAPPPLTNWSGGPDGPRAQIVVDLMDRSQGHMRVSSWYEGFRDNKLCLREMGNAPGYIYQHLKFSDAEGHTLSHHSKNGRHCLNGKPNGPVLAQYVVTPGGWGRHGHQGIVLENWAAFDGRAFLLPRSKVGLRAARIRFAVPEGWTVASPLVEKDGWYEIGGYRAALTAQMLNGSCIGVGPFVGVTRTIGSTEYRVFSYGEWNDALRTRLETRSYALFQWFHDNLGFDLRGPYAVVWTPKVDGDKMFGGSHGNGTCFENTSGDLRAWQLLAHRLGHSVNKYPPNGMSIRDRDDDWFKEGFASYIEVISTAATGAASDEGYWNELYSSYRRDTNKHPDWDFSLAKEDEANGDATEYLHYTKAPLTAKMLDVWAQERTGKGLMGFMKEAFAKYGSFKAPFPVKDELEAYLGISLDDFWQVMITRNGPVVPMWTEYYTKNAKPLENPPAATVGGVSITGDYLFYLASSGNFARFGDIEAFLVKEIENRRRLAELSLPVVPPRFVDKIPELPPEVRYDIARLEANWPKPDPSVLPQVKIAEPARLELNLEHPDGKAFHQLLEDERAHEADLVRHGLTNLTARAATTLDDAKKAKPVLGWKRDDAVVVELGWRVLPASVTVTATRGDNGARSREETVLDPEWSWSRSYFKDNQRPAGDGVVTFVVEPDEGDGGPEWRVQRSFWQRGE